jgi:outer membrane protein TolC
VRIKRVPFGIAAGAVAALVCQPGWAEELTAASAADRAVRASYEAAAARNTQGAAQARVDEASYAFLPRLSVSARYTRLSDFTPSELRPAWRRRTDKRRSVHSGLLPASWAEPTRLADGSALRSVAGYTWKLLRRDQKLSLEAAKAVVRRLVAPVTSPGFSEGE